MKKLEFLKIDGLEESWGRIKYDCKYKKEKLKRLIKRK